MLILQLTERVVGMVNKKLQGGREESCEITGNYGDPSSWKLIGHNCVTSYKGFSSAFMSSSRILTGRMENVNFTEIHKKTKRNFFIKLEWAIVQSFSLSLSRGVIKRGEMSYSCRKKKNKK